MPLKVIVWRVETCNPSPHVSAVLHSPDLEESWTTVMRLADIGQDLYQIFDSMDFDRTAIQRNGRASNSWGVV